MKLLRFMFGARSSARRKLVALAAVLLLVLALRLAWGWWAAATVENALNELRARGEPVQVTDLEIPHVPDAENAVTLQLKAASALKQGIDSPRNSMLEYESVPPFPAEWTQLAEASAQAHGQVFALMRQARQRTGVQWRTGWTSPVYTVVLPSLNNMKWLANTVTDGALYAHVNGDDIEAIDRLIDVLHVARSLHHDQPIVSQLVAIGIESMVYHDVHTIGPGLRLESAAVRDKVRELIEHLLEEEAAWEGVRRAIIFERLVWIDYCQDRAQGTWAIRPMADHTIMRMLPAYELTIQAAEQRNSPDAGERLKQRELDRSGTNSMSLFLPTRNQTVPRYSRWFHPDNYDLAMFLERNFRAIGGRRAAAVSLACQLYHADHGRFPDRLDALVPRYLEQIPADPYHADGRSIGYVIVPGGLPDGGDRPMLYYDAGPPQEPIPAEPLYSWHTPRMPSPAGIEAVRQ